MVPVTMGTAAFFVCVSEASLVRLASVLLQRVHVHGQLQQQQLSTKGKPEFLRWAEGKLSVPGNVP